MSYDIGNLGLRGGRKKRTGLYIGIAVVVVIIIVVVALVVMGVFG